MSNEDIINTLSWAGSNALLSEALGLVSLGIIGGGFGAFRSKKQIGASIGGAAGVLAGLAHYSLCTKVDPYIFGSSALVTAAILWLVSCAPEENKPKGFLAKTATFIGITSIGTFVATAVCEAVSCARG